MNVNKVDFMVPIIYDNPKNFRQELGNHIENSLYLGGKKLHIISQKNNIFKFKDQSIPVWQTAFKIALFITSLGLIPLILLIAKAIYRSSLTDKSFDQVSSGKKKIPNPVITINDIAKKLLLQGMFKKENRVKIKHAGNKYLLSLDDHEAIKIQRFGKVLGRGGFGKVTELIDCKTNQRTALKVATPPKPKYKGKYNLEELKFAEKDLKQEVANLNYLNPKGDAMGIQKPPMTSIFKVNKTYSSQPSSRLAFEGAIYDGSLDKLKVNSLPVETQLDIIYQIVKGVQLFRKLGMVHCDLKPANIFYKKQNGKYFVYVGDFGSAWREGKNKGLAYTKHYATQNDVTEITGSVTNYGEFYSAKKHDIYSLGVTLRELLFGSTKALSSLLKEKMKTALSLSNVSVQKADHFFKTLNRMTVEETHNPALELVSKFIDNDSVRPSIKEVVDAIEGVLTA